MDGLGATSRCQTFRPAGRARRGGSATVPVCRNEVLWLKAPSRWMSKGSSPPPPGLPGRSVSLAASTNANQSLLAPGQLV